MNRRDASSLEGNGKHPLGVLERYLRERPRKRAGEACEMCGVEFQLR